MASPTSPKSLARDDLPEAGERPLDPIRMPELIVALDRPDARRALELVDRLDSQVDHYKVGLELFTRAGAPVIEALHGRGKRVFLDLKLYDIPNTVAAAVRAAAELRVHMLTVHVSGGVAMMQAALDAARASDGDAGPLVLGVTLLTSLTPGEMGRVWDRPPRPAHEEVGRLAALAHEARLDGVVASPLEAEALRQRFREFTIVTPGIRPVGAAADDQNRTATPAAAVRAGADYLVIGRPIHAAPDPAAAARAILDEMRGADETSAAREPVQP